MSQNSENKFINTVAMDRRKTIISEISQINEVHGRYIYSYESVKVFLDKTDLQNPNEREVAENLLVNAFYKDTDHADEIIQLAQDKKISPNKIMEKFDLCVPNVYHHAVEAYTDQDISRMVSLYSKLIAAGADQKPFSPMFEYYESQYYGWKNGKRVGREGEGWMPPQPAQAALVKKIITALVDAGYKLEMRQSELAEDIAADKAREAKYGHLKKEYEKFSEQDKKLIADLQNDNIDEIRKVLNSGKLPDNVEQYMDYVSDAKGLFYRYYKDVMYKNDKPVDVEPYNFANAESKYIYNATYESSLDDLMKLTDFKPKGIENAIAKRFHMDFDRPDAESYLAELNTSYKLADKLNKMNPECKNAVSLLMAKKIESKFQHANPDEPGHIIRLLAFTMKLYDVSEEAGKNALRATMLKFRTTGSNEERRFKANLFKQALKRENFEGKIKNDETIKAVSSVSYTPMSSLNRQLKKYGKELQDR